MSEQAIRLSAFVGMLLAVALWELIAPRRPLQTGKATRWSTNLALVGIDTLTVKLLFPLLPIAFAHTVTAQGWGLSAMVAAPLWLKTAAAVIALDFIIYLQHVMFHHQPLLWRLHRVHHTDLDLDVTSGVRFHPGEIIISMVIKLGAIALLGAPPQAVLIFEVALNSCALFNHGNIRLPDALDQLLRPLLVTPDMHRVHHSTIVKETNSNYGFCLSWWDRLCRTYRPQPRHGHLEMTIGLNEYRDSKALTLPHLLVNPFKAR
jgi:sterol desaturase/sphingolipid hydroxylase (fatty acid hydroxylase superfamily)